MIELILAGVGVYLFLAYCWALNGIHSMMLDGQKMPKIGYLIAAMMVFIWPAFWFIARRKGR